MTVDLTDITLDKGKHKTPDDGMCLIEACAYVSGEPFTDHPHCVSELLSETGRALNDLLPNHERQKLAPLIPYLIRTAGDGLDEQRSGLAWAWIVHVYAPTWLRLAGLNDHAATLETADPDDALPLLIAARNAAWTATRDVALNVAVGDVARNANWDVAWDAAAWSPAAGDDAWDAAWEAAWEAIAKAVQVAAGDDEPGAALRPTSNALRASFINVYRDMVMLNKGPEPTP